MSVFVDLNDVEDVSPLENEEKTDGGRNMLPEQFKTVQGKMVRLVGKQKRPDFASIAYATSKIQGSALLNAHVMDTSALLAEVNAMFDDGFLNDDQGVEVESLVLPIDAVDLSAKLKGVIVDCDLSGYANGFTWLLDTSSEVSSGGLDLANALRAVLGFIKAIRHLAAKGYYYQDTIDGHQLYFNVEYGSFRLVYDGVGIAKGGKTVDGVCLPQPSPSPTAHGISGMIVFLLTGAWPKGMEHVVMSCPVSDDNCATWDSDTDTFCGSTKAQRVWKALPSAIRDAIRRSCFSESRESIGLDDWIQILQKAIDEKEECVFCGNTVFHTAEQCLFCGKTTKKDDLLTKWSIHGDNQPGILRMSFGRGTFFPGELLGISSGSSPFLVVMYNQKGNLLGIKNASNITWRIVKSGVTEELKPGSIAPVEKGMSISFDGHPRVEMRFLGYEYK